MRGCVRCRVGGEVRASETSGGEEEEEVVVVVVVVVEGRGGGRGRKLTDEMHDVLCRLLHPSMLKAGDALPPFLAGLNCRASLGLRHGVPACAQTVRFVPRGGRCLFPNTLFCSTAISSHAPIMIQNCLPTLISSLPGKTCLFSQRREHSEGQRMLFLIESMRRKTDDFPSSSRAPRG